MKSGRRESSALEMMIVLCVRGGGLGFRGDIKMELNTLKIIMNDYCEKVVPNLFKNSAQMSAKNKENQFLQNEVSYPVHVINAVFTAAAIYSYKHLDSNHKESVKNLKLLMSIVTLHDIGKYFETKLGIIGGNSIENVKRYFENDVFKLKNFFSDIVSIDINELAWLIQHTELNDSTQDETIGHRTSYGKLADYSRLGDKVASLTKHELYSQKIFDTLKYYNVHVVQIPKFPQILIRREFLKALKKYHQDRGAIPFLLYEGGFFYISDKKIVLNQGDIEEYFLNNVKSILKLSQESENKEERGKPEEEPLLNLRIDFQSIDDDSILNFPLKNEDKKEIILDQIIKKLPKAMKDFVIAFPADAEIQKKLATMVYYLYKSDDIFKDDRASFLGKNKETSFNVFDGIVLKKKKETKSKKTKCYLIIPDTNKPKEQEVKLQLYKIYAAKQIIENYAKYGSFDDGKNLDIIYHKCDEFLNRQLEGNNKSNVFSLITNNISIDFEQAFQAEESPKDKTELCFLCGTKTTKEYKAGKKYFLQAGGFSKRGRLSDNQKNICSLCLIERNLIEGLFAQN